MTELEKLIEQKKEIERRIKELKDNSKYYGSDAEIKVDSYKRCAGAKEMFRVSAKRMSYNEFSDGKYIGLVDVPMEDKDDAIKYLAEIKQGLAEYFKENEGYFLIEHPATPEVGYFTGNAIVNKAGDPKCGE